MENGNRDRKKKRTFDLPEGRKKYRMNPNTIVKEFQLRKEKALVSSRKAGTWIIQGKTLSWE